MPKLICAHIAKKIAVFTAALTVSACLSISANFALAAGQSSIIVDGNTGEVLHASNPDATRFPASITKVMTLYMLFEQLEAGKISLDTSMEVSKFASNQAPSKLGLQPGQELTVRTAIDALSIKSANDVAVVVAEHIGGSEDKFAQMMTQKARQLGMKGTNFVNASGLPDEEQVTTARDLAILGYSIQSRFPQYSKAFAKREFSYNGRDMGNHNKLLGRVEGIDGIKTGYTRMSGFNLLSSMRIGGRHLIGVVLGGETGRSRDVKMHQLLAANFEEASPKKYALRQFAGRPLSNGTALASNEAIKEEISAPSARPAPVSVAAAPTPRIATDKPLMLASADPTALPVSSTLSGVKPSAQLQKPATKPETVEKTAPKPNIKSKPGKIVNAAKEDEENEKPNAKQLATKPALAWQKGKDGKMIAKNAAPTPKSKTIAETKSIKEKYSPYGVQIAAVPDQKSANAMLTKAKSKASKQLANARAYTEPVKKSGDTLYRARFSNLDKSAAEGVCEALKKSAMPCIVTRL